MFWKIRDWMHGRGRNIVITIVIIGALLIILDYFFNVRGGQWGLQSFPVGQQTEQPVNTEEIIPTTTPDESTSEDSGEAVFQPQQDTSSQGE